MKIYTRTGDKGKTMLYTGKCVQKDCPYMEVLGAVDECNSTIGIAISLLPHEPAFWSIKEQLVQIQHTLFDLGAAVATPLTEASQKKIDKTRFNETAIEELEQWIDDIDKEVPKLQHFILPSGHTAGAVLHLARSICRRAERGIVPLYNDKDIDAEPLIYLNRLSDFLFMAARFVNYLLQIPETEWSKKGQENG